MKNILGIGLLGIGAYALYEWWLSQQGTVSNVPAVVGPTIPNTGTAPTNQIAGNNATIVSNYPYTSNPAISVNPPVISTAVSLNPGVTPMQIIPNNAAIPMNTSTQTATTDIAGQLWAMATGQINGIGDAGGYMDANGRMNADHWSWYLSQLGISLNPSQFGQLFTGSNLYTVNEFVANLKQVGLAGLRGLGGLGRVYVSGAMGLGGLGVLGRGFGINSLSPNDASKYEMATKLVM